MSAQFDPTKPVQTRDGRKVTVLRTDLKHQQPIVAIVHKAGDFSESVEQFYADGAFICGDESAWDLVNVPEKIEASIWLVFFKNSHPLVYGNYPKRGDFVGALAIKQFILSAELGEGLEDDF